MLEIKGLEASVDEKAILKGIDLAVAPGEVHAIMGPNGSGKTSLLRVLAGLWAPIEGTVTTPKVADDENKDKAVMMWLPQRPYLLQGSLRDQVVYPRTALADGNFHDFDPEDACVGALGECADVDGGPPRRCAPAPFASDPKSAQESPSPSPPSSLPNPEGCRGDDAGGFRGDDIAIPLTRARRASSWADVSRRNRNRLVPRAVRLTWCILELVLEESMPKSVPVFVRSKLDIYFHIGLLYDTDSICPNLWCPPAVPAVRISKSG